MPVMSNPILQYVPSLAWDGTTYRAADIRNYVRFGIAFEVITTLTADAVFTMEVADADPANKCNPGAFADHKGIAYCHESAAPTAATSITIKSGTVAGTIIGATVDCKGYHFVRLKTGSGQVANVRAMWLRQGPKNN